MSYVEVKNWLNVTNDSMISTIAQILDVQKYCIEESIHLNSLPSTIVRRTKRKRASRKRGMSYISFHA